MDTAVTQEFTQEQLDAQQAFLQKIGLEMFKNLMQSAELKAWYYSEQTTDDQRAQFDDLCIKYATLNFVIFEQNKPFYNQLFDALTSLTGYTGWFAQLNFMSKEVAAALQSQQIAQDLSGSEEFDEDEDLE